jgi:integrase
MIAADVTQGIKLPRIKSDGRHTWTEDEITAFEATHAIGTKALLAFALTLYTGQRVGDVVRMGLQHVRDGVITVRQQKTGAELAIPVHPHLRAVLDATPSGNLTFLAAISGHATLREVERYTKAADQQRLARNAMAQTRRGLVT